MDFQDEQDKNLCSSSDNLALRFPTAASHISAAQTVVIVATDDVRMGHGR
jgi:hypothetical protein